MDRGLMRYLERGVAEQVDQAYKCRIRTPWHRPPIVPAPDLFFTYMSHRYPRLIENGAGVSFVNSMHGIRVAQGLPEEVRHALPYLTLSAVTMLGAEIHGRGYGGGVLKMEPREAAGLPVPRVELLVKAWQLLLPHRDLMDEELARGDWERVAVRVDQILLGDVCGVSALDVARLHVAVQRLRSERIGRSGPEA